MSEILSISYFFNEVTLQSGWKLECLQLFWRHLNWTVLGSLQSKNFSTESLSFCFICEFCRVVGECKTNFLDSDRVHLSVLADGRLSMWVRTVLILLWNCLMLYIETLWEIMLLPQTNLPALLFPDMFCTYCGMCVRKFAGSSIKVKLNQEGFLRVPRSMPCRWSHCR